MLTHVVSNDIEVIRHGCRSSNGYNQKLYGVIQLNYDLNIAFVNKLRKKSVYYTTLFDRPASRLWYLFVCSLKNVVIGVNEVIVTILYMK